MKTDVPVLGVSCTRFGAFHGAVDARTLGCEAIRNALSDAGLESTEIEAAYVSYSVTGVITGQESMIGQMSLEDAGIVGIPIVRVENACSSGSSALREAILAVQAGAADLVLAVGLEVMTSVDTSVAIQALNGAGDLEREGALGMTFPAHFAMMAQAHELEFGTTREQLASVAVKNHAHGVLNEKAQFRRPISVGDVVGARAVADPLTVLDCCPITDGAAAVIVGACERSGRGGVRVRAAELVSGRYDDDRPLTRFDATIEAASAAYEHAGVGSDEIDLWELHDCFTIAEVVHTEDLGLCAKGDGGPFIESGATALGGSSPVNVSGGLKAKGHPVGATGLGQIYELTQQLRGEAGRRQVAGARTGLAHCMGGFLHGDCGSIAITVLGT
jgi:acetyl-CoA C-acetyltransferase